MSDKEEEKKSETVEDQDQEKELPLLDDLLNKFNVEGLFGSAHRDILKAFLTLDSQLHLDELLQKPENAAFGEYILTKVVILILDHHFSDFKGEWELIVRKAKKAINPIKQATTDELQW